MDSSSSKIDTIDQYIARYSEEQQRLLQEVREAIRAAAPAATEAIKYQMPTFCYCGNLVHFAICKEHMGFYPTPSAIIEFAEELEKYQTSKGAIQFPLGKKMPLALIKKIVKFRVTEMESKARAKSKRK